MTMEMLPILCAVNQAIGRHIAMAFNISPRDSKSQTVRAFQFSSVTWVEGA